LDSTYFKVAVRDIDYWQTVERKQDMKKVFYRKPHRRIVTLNPISEPKQKMTHHRSVSHSPPPMPLTSKGTINQDLFNHQVFRGLDHKLKLLEDSPMPKDAKDGIENEHQAFLEKVSPHGAARSMSPWLLANAFKFDIYELYKTLEEKR